MWAAAAERNPTGRGQAGHDLADFDFTGFPQRDLHRSLGLGVSGCR